MAHASTTDWGSAIRSEASAGLAPRSYGSSQPSEPVVALELLPTSGFRLSHTDYTFTTRYQQRWYLRQPNMLDYDRPLLMHRLTLAYLRQWTPRLTFAFTAGAAGGTMDFLSTTTFLTPSSVPSPSSTGSSSTGTPPGAAPTRTTLPATVPRATVLQVLMLNASTRLGYQITRRQDAELSLTAMRQTPIASDGSGLTRTQQLSTSLGYGYQLSWNTSVRSVLTLSEIQSILGNYQSGIVQSTLAHAWSDRTASTAMLGVAAFRSDNTGDMHVYPNAGATIAHTRGAQGRRLNLTASSFLSGFFDPMTSRLRTMVGVGGGAAKELGRRWTLNVRADLTLPATTEPLTGSGSAPTFAETFANASIGLGRPIGTQARFDTGVRYNLFATHPSQLIILNQQAWLFVGFSLWNGTDQASRGSWVL